MVTGETCAKCGDEPRAGRAKLGNACLAKQRQRSRAKVSDMSDTPRPTAGTTSPDDTPRRRAGSHAECERRIGELTEEVARLKRELAQAGRRAAPMPRRVEEPAKPRKGGFSRSTDPRGAPQKELTKGQGLPHGPNCECIACRAARSERTERRGPSA